MGRAIKKVANSADPRDWHYLKWWQVWANAMPPLLYRFTSPGSCPLGYYMDADNWIPPWDSFLSNWTDSVVWYSFLLVNIPGGPIPFWIKEFRAEIDVHDPNGPLPLDPDGLPYNWHVWIRTFDAPAYYNEAHGYAMNTPFDAEIHLSMIDPMGNPSYMYPNGITMTPVPYNTPTRILNAQDICQ